MSDPEVIRKMAEVVEAVESVDGVTVVENGIVEKPEEPTNIMEALTGQTESEEGIMVVAETENEQLLEERVNAEGVEIGVDDVDEDHEETNE